MKSKFLKLNVLFIFTLFAMSNCDTADEIVSETESLSVSDIESIEEVDMVVEEMSTSIEFAFIEEEYGIAIGRGTASASFFPDCLTRTVVKTDTSKTITLDYGEGCEIRGRFMSGVITMSYERNPDLHTRTISVAYDNYKINHRLIEGSHTIVRIKENDNGNPESTATFNIEVTWDNGKTTSRQGTKIREWVEGVGNRVWSDNVYLITGEWTTTKRNGNVISAVVTAPLRRELACKFLVSGVIDLTKNNRSGTLDFGDGECDNKALLTLDDGTEKEITLKH